MEQKRVKILAAAMCVAAGVTVLPSSGQMAMTPTTLTAEWARSWWLPRFDGKRAECAKGDASVLFIGDSITHGWETSGREVWNAYYTNAACRAVNAGFSGDCTENVLWRFDHGGFDGIDPKAVVIMIGTNNTGHRTALDRAPWYEPPLDTILGIQAIVGKARTRWPKAKIILHPIFPRGALPTDPLRVRNDVVNDAIRRLADGKDVLWCDFNSRLLTPAGELTHETAKDLLHPGAAGYRIWAESLKGYLDYAFGRAPKAPARAAAPAVTALPTNTPVTVRAAIQDYFLLKDPRFREKRAEQCADRSGYYDAVWLGDSITHFWEKSWSGGPTVFAEKFGSYRILNAGFGGARTQNVLWNIEHGGFLDGFNTRLVQLMIGTNNTWSDSAEDIAAGVKACIQAIRRKQPGAKILLLPLLPREVAHKRGTVDYARKNGEMVMPKQKAVNELIRKFADGRQVIWCDFSDRFLGADGLPDVRLLADGTHPNAAGYRAWSDAVLPVYRNLLGNGREASGGK